jgi:hypothetical protein
MSQNLPFQETICIAQHPLLKASTALRPSTCRKMTTISIQHITGALLKEDFQD